MVYLERGKEKVSSGTYLYVECFSLSETMRPTRERPLFGIRSMRKEYGFGYQNQKTNRKSHHRLNPLHMDISVRNCSGRTLLHHNLRYDMYSKADVHGYRQPDLTVKESI